ncbi:hypothetical protein AB0K48_02165 [Nonomuraea sp. NPDC055795]
MLDLTFVVAVAAVTAQFAHASGSCSWAGCSGRSSWRAAAPSSCRSSSCWPRWSWPYPGGRSALAALGAGLEVAVEQSRRQLAAAPSVIGYAVAVPIGPRSRSPGPRGRAFEHVKVSLPRTAGPRRRR